MWSTYKTEQDAIAYLEKQGFRYNPDSGWHERGEPFISLARGIVGQCLDGIWIITRA